MKDFAELMADIPSPLQPSLPKILKLTVIEQNGLAIIEITVRSKHAKEITAKIIDCLEGKEGKE